MSLAKVCLSRMFLSKIQCVLYIEKFILAMTPDGYSTFLTYVLSDLSMNSIFSIRLQSLFISKYKNSPLGQM